MTPRPRLFVLFSIALVPFLLGVWEPGFHAIGWIANLLAISLAVIDRVQSPSLSLVDASREVSEVLSVGTRNRVVIRLFSRAATPLLIEVHDEPPTPSSTEDLPATVLLPPRKVTDVAYWLEPHRRGNARFEAVHLRTETRFGLWNLSERRSLETAARIYPDVRSIHKLELLAMRNRLDEAGLKRLAVRGQGGEFDRLREYRREDERRRIDWKASAKYRRLISREYDVERNQNVTILLDCGRSMGHETDGISHLDSGLNSSAILSYIALAQGDNVSLMAFSNRVERFVGPLRGKSAVQRLVREMYDVEARGEVSDYGLACDELLRRQRKRALVILVTHAVDEQQLRTVSSYVRTLTRPHVLLCVFLRDRALADCAARVPRDEVEAFQCAGAAELLSKQAQRVAELREAGALVVETYPNEASAILINQYLDLKMRHLL